MGRILFRYILFEILESFALILGIFLVVLLMGRMLKIVEMIVRHGVSPLDVLRMFIYLIPYVLPLAIPMATLIAGMISFSRMSGDLEITAMKSSGISLYQLLPPVVLISVAMALASLFLTVQGTPWGAFAFRQLVFQMAKKHFSVAFKQGVFNEIFPGFLVYADRIRAGEDALEGVFIHDQRSSEVSFQILARRGTLGRSRPEGEILFLRLENGAIYQVSLSDGKLRRIHFDRYEINLDLTFSKVQEQLRRTRKKEMDTRALVQRIQYLRAHHQRPVKFLSEFHRRLSIPVTCFIFGLLALPLALQSRPQGRSHGFMLGVLVILIFYLIFSAGETLSETGRLPPWIALWTPNLLLGLFTMVLIVRTARERPSVVLVAANALLDLLQKWGQRLLGGNE